MKRRLHGAHDRARGHRAGNRHLTSIGLVPVVVLSVACGNDTTATTTETPAPSATTLATSHPVDETQPAPSTTPPSTALSTDSTDLTTAPVGDEDFCGLNDEIARLLGELAQRSGDEAEAVWRDIEVVVARITEAAPPELVDDANEGARYYTELGEALEATGYDPIAAVESMPLDPESAEIDSRISAYLEANC